MDFIRIDKLELTEPFSMRNLHSHTYYEIYFLLKGSRSLLLPNVVYKVDAPAVVIIPPHALHLTEGGPYARINIDVSPLYLQEYEKKFFQAHSFWMFRPEGSENEALMSTLEKLLRVQNNTAEGEYLTKTLFSYTVYLLSTLRKKISPPSNIKNNSSDNIPLLVLKVIDYLNENYDAPHTLESLARQFYCSKGALMYNFKKHVKCSPIEFLLSVRLTVAKQLLHETNKSVSEIAELCGFSSANYFGLIFKKKEKVSPANYRKNLILQ